MARLWEEQRPLRFPLVTTGGEEIQVVYRGWRRWDRGPDFAGALIAWPGAELRIGEVEIHLRSSDWWAHGHHRDPHYNGVILQVVLWDDASVPTIREDGVTVPVVTLAPHLTVPLEILLSSPLPVAPPPIPCWRGTQDDSLEAMLEGCGRDRLAAKAARFEAGLTCIPPDQLLYQGIAAALGYSQNRLPFHRLAERVPLDLLLTWRGDREALLLGAAGLLPSQRGLILKGDDRYVAALEARWAADGPSWVWDPMDPREWEFFRVRPANFPTRRVAALAGLVARWPRDGLAETLADLVVSLESRAVPRALEELALLRSPRSYWDERCDFDRCLRRPMDLVGRHRAAEIAVNVFLPFLVARASHLDDSRLGGRIWEVYRLYPKRGDNELSRYVATHVTGVPRPRAARSACRQQGLLHLYWSWCKTKWCDQCPVQRTQG